MRPRQFTVPKGGRLCGRACRVWLSVLVSLEKNKNTKNVALIGLSFSCCPTGPAHAVYFATYELVKELAGGNVDAGHHPVAAGKVSIACQESEKGPN